MATCGACGRESPDGFAFCPACGAPLGVQPAPERRKLATLVFCDVTGSTALGERVGNAGFLSDAEKRAMVGLGASS